MSQLIDNLNLIVSIKSDIKSAIENKGVDMTGVSFGSYADKIGEISGGGQFVTEPLNITSNGTYTPGQGVDGFSTVTVDVPQSVTGYTEKELTEGVCITDLNNSASLVGTNAFTNNSCLNTVNLSMCKTIGNQAFQYCRSLQTVSLPVCSYVGNYAFHNCYSLTSVNLPVCSYISDNAFNNCKSLSAIDLPVCSYIGNGLFRYNTGLISVSLPRLMKINGATAFEHCESLSSLYFPKLRVLNGNWIFNDCKNLSIVDIPAVLTNGSNLFERDSKLKELYINSETYVTPKYMLSKTTSGITSIYTNINNVSRFIAASGWSSYSDKIIGVGDPSVFMLSYSDGIVNGMTKCIEQSYYSYLDMTIDVARTNVVSVDLPNCDYISSNTFFGYSGLTNISLPNCEYIDDNAFCDCSSLTSVNLPMCSYIGSYAFIRCRSLTSVNLPMCSYIGDNAFQDCRSLTSANLPMCSYIGSSAFNYCLSLSVVYIGTSIDTVCVLNNSNAFDINEALTSIYVPASLVESYKTATNWTYYSNKIVGI